MSETKENTSESLPDTNEPSEQPKPKKKIKQPDYRRKRQTTKKIIPGVGKSLSDIRRSVKIKIQRENDKLAHAQAVANQLRINRNYIVNKLRHVDNVIVGKAISNVIDTEMIKLAPPKAQKVVTDDENVAFRPNPGPQTDFLAASEKEVLYGGARGGGKSYAMLIDPLRYFGNPNARALLLRRTMPEVRDLIHKSQTLYKKAYPKAVWREQEKEWRFPSGARMEFGYCETASDVLRYQGQAYTWIGIDELGQFADESIVNDLSGSLRSIDPSLPTYMRFTANPGGPGHCLPFGDVLTENGWTDIREIKVGTKVLTVDKNSNVFYTAVSDTVKEQYSGNMVKRVGRGLHLEFTENHRLPMLTASGIEIRPFYDLPGQVDVVRAANSFVGQSPDTFSVEIKNYRKPRLKQPTTISYSDYAELMGWFLSEGHTLDRDKEFGISQTKEPQRTNIRNLLVRCGFKFRESKSGFQVSCANWYSYLAQFGKCRNKFVPKELLNSAHLRELFTSLMDGDGHWTIRHEAGTYYTLSKQLADDAAEIAVKLGYSVYTASRNRKNRDGVSYEVNFSNRKTTELNTGNHLYNVNTSSSNVNITKEPFNGEVYCITVPETETFFVRQNGCVWLSGNTWIKRRFIDPSPHNKAFSVEVNTAIGKKYITRRYIPAKLTDNPYLVQSEDYMIALSNLPEHKRRQWLDGDWDATEGSAFPEFDRKFHVIAPFEVPRTWPRFRAGDWGYSSPACVLWFAADYDNTLYVYREYYGKGLNAEAFARRILELEAGDPKPISGIMDSSLWAKRGDTGPSIIETMAKVGCMWRPSDRSAGSRISGKLEVHRRLAVDASGQPKLKIFSNCTSLISTLPTLPLDDTNPEDVDTKAEDHAYDALRYGVMSRPLSATRSALFTSVGIRQKTQPADAKFGY